MVRDDQPEAREGQAGLFGVAERFVLPMKPGNAGGGKGPQFKTDARRGEGPRRLGNLSTPKSVQKLQMALHAKAKAEAEFPLLCPVRQDLRARTSWLMLMPSAAPTRAHRVWTARTSTDIEAYGVERWLGELALALREGSVSTGYHQTCVHREIQRQAKAAWYIDRARSGLHDSSDAGAGTDLRR